MEAISAADGNDVVVYKNSMAGIRDSIIKMRNTLSRMHGKYMCTPASHCFTLEIYSMLIDVCRKHCLLLEWVHIMSEDLVHKFKLM